MSSDRKAFLVVRRDDGAGNVFVLHPGKRYVLGRANTNDIVLNDDLCSRQHAEVASSDGKWILRDLGSLNGTRVNDELIQGPVELHPLDEIGLGRCRFWFVESLDQLPHAPAETSPRSSGIAIRKRLGQTRYDFQVPAADDDSVGAAVRNRISQDLSLLYRLALNMGSASTNEQLIQVVLSGLLEATPADTAAVLEVQDGESRLLAYQSRLSHEQYREAPETMLRDVIASGEGILAEDSQRLRHHRRGNGSSTEVSSFICAPVKSGQAVTALLYLYCTDPFKSLGSEDLELVVAISKTMAVAWQSLRRQAFLLEENQRLKAQVAAEVQLVGQSPALEEIKNQIAQVAPTNATVLIRGESGVGKELVARAIHLASPRRDGPFVCLNCAALAESLLESELFGHEKGAFTGATQRKIGKFEAAHNGTIFLDEIGEMNPSAQAKLLRVLEGHPYERVGGSEPIRVNVRVVAATNRPLEEAVNAGQFRRDLYFRLQVIEIRVPPLRERRSDIPVLAEFFLRRFLEETGRRLKGFTQAALEKMTHYDWPGNVRELRNVIERAVALGKGPMLDAPDIWLSGLELTGAREAVSPAYVPRSLEEVEKEHIAATLRHTDWNKSQAAAILGIERSTLDRKIKAYDIQR
ncbi:MAG: sigma 54-interacting transcriptional regulator [Gemmatales bacterium]|nr:sigma 54-interacting transcriptional regulator [Gemmatales bacterium]MDW8388074.1 sigma 54-interacting transcriptional regulator [Gemmatales bacterium]